MSVSAENRQRFRLLAIVVLGLWAVAEPPAVGVWTDTVRHAGAAVLAWPFRAVASRLGPRRGPVPDAAAEKARGLWAAFERQEAEEGRGDAVRVVWSAEDAEYLVVELGSDGGVRRGSAAAADGVLVGFVDRVEKNLARVQKLASGASRFAGQVVFSGPDGKPEIRAKVLLRGAGLGLAQTQQGSILADDLVGGAVMTIAAPGIPADLVIGRVEPSRRLGQAAVRLAASEKRIHQVMVYDADGRATLPASSRSAFAEVKAEVLVTGDFSPGTGAYLIGCGMFDGAGLSNAVVFRGRLVGEIADLGRNAAWVRPFPTRTSNEAVWCLATSENGRIASVEKTASDLSLDRPAFSIGHPRPHPRGLFVRDAGSSGEVERPRPGDTVAVHVYRHRDEWKALAAERQP